MAKLGQYKLDCPRGHLKQGDNLLVSGGTRFCVTCKKESEKKYLAQPYAKAQRDIVHARSRNNTRQSIRDRWKIRKDTARKFVDAVKSVPCNDCNLEFPTFVMDLDHVTGKKKMGISHMVDGGYTVRAITEEIKKCEVVCANCHRIRTETRRLSRG